LIRDERHSGPQECEKNLIFWYEESFSSRGPTIIRNGVIEREKIVIDAQPRGGNRQNSETAKRFCKVEHLPVCFVELFQSVYRLRPAPSQAGGCLVMM
jgi:hypothetical protein